MGLHTVEMALELALQNPRVLWLGSPVEHSFPLSQGQYNSNDGCIEMLEEAGFLVDVCPNVEVAIKRLKESAGRNWHVAAVCSGGQDSTHLGSVVKTLRCSWQCMTATPPPQLRAVPCSRASRTPLSWSALVDQLTWSLAGPII